MITYTQTFFLFFFRYFYFIDDEPPRFTFRKRQWHRMGRQVVVANESHELSLRFTDW